MSKDWTGNKPTAFVQMGASNHSILEREENDFYATEPSAIDDLLSVGTFSKNIWECAVGQGHLAERLKEHGYTVKCTDLVDRGYPNTEIVDFPAVGSGSGAGVDLHVYRLYHAGKYVY